jgi:hypothetical protein
MRIWSKSRCVANITLSPAFCWHLFFNPWTIVAAQLLTFTGQVVLSQKTQGSFLHSNVHQKWPSVYSTSLKHLIQLLDSYLF